MNRKSGFFDPATAREFESWQDIESTLGSERGIALIEHGNMLDHFAAAMAWLSKPDHRPHWLVVRENFWAVCARWLSVTPMPYVYAGRIPPQAAE